MSATPAAPAAALATLAVALALTSATRPALAAGLGSLFFTPEQRSRLDRQRNGDRQPPTDSALLVIDGVVRRSDGRTVIWINGVAQRGGIPGIRIFPSPQDPSRVTLGIQGGAPVRLRVGESVNRATRKRDDGLAGGSIRIRGGKR
ncbi:MAG TPA: hypothetical protein VMV91_13505 [Rhodocyclaceae bacterium]|nr:hypothetical protein [Rhodocyclaceae bacterium]